MALIPVMILDIWGRRMPFQLDGNVPVFNLLPLVIKQFDLPENIRYQLIHSASRQPLHPNATLHQAQIFPGTELYVQPVRDGLLRALQDQLYDEAKGLIQDKLFDLAKQKLDGLYRLDPTYPDPDHLRQKLWQPGFAPNQPHAQMMRRQPPKPKKGVSPMLIVGAVLAAGAVGLVGVVGVVALAIGLVARSATGITTQPTPVLGTGDVQVTLTWDTPTDLDLHVIDPAGEEISFTHTQSTSGGTLDVDANSSCNGLTNPVENVYWPYGGAPSGSYSVYVNYYQDCGYTGPVNYTLTIRMDDRVIDTISGTLDYSSTISQTTSFNR